MSRPTTLPSRTLPFAGFGSAVMCSGLLIRCRRSLLSRLRRQQT